MIRWKYVVPRLGMLLLLLAAVCLGTDWLLRQALVQTGQRALGSRVEIGTLDTNPFRGQLVLDDVVVADPDSALRNLFVARQAHLDLDMGAALRKKLIVREGRVEGMRIHTARASDGRLQSDDAQGPGSPSLLKGVDQLGQRSEVWLESSLERFETELEDELQTVQLARELKERWPAEYHQLATAGKRLRRQTRQLHDRVEQIVDDPVNHLADIQPTLSATEQLRRDALRLAQRVDRLQRQMQADRAALDQAKRQDIRYLRERFRLDQLDGDSLTEYLLGPVWARRVRWATHWIQRSRQLGDSTAADDKGNHATGIDVLFPGFPSTADVLVRALHLHGSGTVDGEDYSFRGTLNDLTHQPQRHTKPITLQIEASGAIQLTAEGTLDRRHDIPMDRYHLHAPAVAQNGQTLGKPTRFAVVISPGQANIQADITVHDNQLGGQISLSQDQLSVTPRLPKKYTQYLAPDNLTAVTSRITQLQASVALSGTLSKPKYKVHSSLGRQLASGLQQAFQQELNTRQQELAQIATERVQHQLNQLQDELNDKHGDLFEQIELGRNQIDQLRQRLTTRLGSHSDLIGLGKKLLSR